MAIVGTDLKFYQSKVVNDTNSNGGRISTTQIPSGLSNAWWPNLTEAQLVSGITQYRKSFLRVDNSNSETGYNCRIGLWKPTAGSDELYLFAGTHSDIQSDISSPDLYGAGKLDLSVLAGASQIKVLVEDGTRTLFRAGDLIRISDQTTVGSGGNAEYKIIDTGGVSVAGDVVTLTLTSALANDYSTTNTYVSSMIETTEVKCTTTGKVVTSSAGTFDESLMTLNNVGTHYHTVTFTFTSASTFTVESDDLTLSPTTGSVSSIYAPVNMSVGLPYFSISPGAWNGTWAQNDTLVITTIPPAVPIWEMRHIPVNSAAIASQTRTLMVFIES